MRTVCWPPPRLCYDAVVFENSFHRPQEETVFRASFSRHHFSGWTPQRTLTHKGSGWPAKAYFRDILGSFFLFIVIRLN